MTSERVAPPDRPHPPTRDEIAKLVSEVLDECSAHDPFEGGDYLVEAEYAAKHGKDPSTYHESDAITDRLIESGLVSSRPSLPDSLTPEALNTIADDLSVSLSLTKQRQRDSVATLRSWANALSASTETP